MIGVRINRRVVARVDPSDVVQETLLIPIVAFPST